MIDIVLHAFALSLPALVAIDKGRMGFAFIFFLIAMMPIWAQFLFFGSGESPLVLLILKWVIWCFGFFYSFKIKSGHQKCNEIQRT